MRIRLRRCLHPLLLSSGILPLSAMLGSACMENQLWLWLMWPFLYLLFTLLCLQLPGRWRLGAGILCSAVLLAAGAVLLPLKSCWFLFALPVFHAVMLLASLPFAAWETDRELPAAWQIVCLFIHIAAQIFLGVQKRLGFGARCEAAEEVILISFLLFLLLALLSMSRLSLCAALPRSREIPVSIRTRSYLFTVGLLAISAAIAAIPAFVRLLTDLWRTLWKAFSALTQWIASILPQTGGGSGMPSEGGMDFSAVGPAREAGLFLKILEKAAVVLAYAAFLIMLLWAAKQLWRLIRKIMKRISNQLCIYIGATSEDYVDEIISTREAGDSLFRPFAFRRQSKQKYAALSPRDQIRFRYSQLRRRHPEWLASQTARDTLPADSAPIYEKARYSNLPVTPQDAEQFDTMYKRR